MNLQTGHFRADRAQSALREHFWNREIGMYDIETPCPDGACNTIFHYWWMAHAVEALVDGLVRTGESHYRFTLAELFDGLLKRNGGAWPNALYDDMEWMAIAWLRAYEATKEEKYKQAALVLWEDIKTGWNDHMGGGIAWQKSQLDYKNTPANAPAVILATRLHRIVGKAEDLDWAVRIYDWQKRTLVDPDSGFVWDGINRTGDGTIDKDWEFTYCQGVFIGAAHELYSATGDESYLLDAERTANAAILRLTDKDTALLPGEGNGDGGLFKGILVRYAANLATDFPSRFPTVADVLVRNALILWDQGRDEERTLFGPVWNRAPSDKVELGTQICGVTLFEMAAKLEAILLTA
ncbi:glycoside hydrolase family 76 protein [Cohnella endophytica]|uniref:glycoside hydrolase family 76 protein n=1 Tax=Cohnella endophytica TaxID=2419778 RepID=UPI0018F79D35|nr:glycoside hydrolase family 76 protein [Cohnella endophytica]